MSPGISDFFAEAQRLVAFAKINEPFRYDEKDLDKIWMWLKYIKTKKKFKRSKTVIWRII